MKIDLNQFLESFFEEAVEHIESMEAGLLELEASPEDPELLNTIFRAAHSIKGASSTFGVHSVGEFTHVLESLLDRLRDGEIKVSEELTELLLTSVDVLSALLSAARDGTAGPDNVDEVISKLHEINQSGQADAPADKTSSEDTAASASGPKRYRVTFKPSREFFHFGLDPLLLLRDLSDLGTASDMSVDDSDLPPLAEMDPESCYLGFSLVLHSERPVSDLQDVFMFVDDDSLVEITSESADENREPSESSEPSQPTATESSPSPDATSVAANTQRSPQRESVRVNGERLDDMINQIGELVIGISMVEQEWAGMNAGGESAAIVQLSKIVRDLQEQSLSLRMVPIAGTFQKMTRIVRDLSSKLGKQIQFDIIGEETELDKTVVDQIGDPLIHMVRNSVDHGIESPEERIAAGKPAEGRIKVHAYHQSGNIYITLEDDGKGLDLEAIRHKAIDRGIVSADEKLSHTEICDLIFHAGLSTAKTVSDISGRGVGMDVVRRNIEALKGSVSISSEPGRGTKLTVRLPLTLAILDGLLVRIAEQVYIVPLLSVVESFRPAAGDIKRLANGMKVVQVRGEVVPILHLHSILDIPDAVTNPCEGLLVIVEDHETKLALLVDDLIGQQQAVIKNLESNFQKVDGIAGATILGNGRVALILDIVGIKSLLAMPSSITR